MAEAGTQRFATHNWRSAGAGNLGGWAVSRCLHFLNVLTGSVGTVGGTMPSAWNKFKPKPFSKPPAQKFWNELHFPNEYPLAHYEMSFLLPHFLKEGRGTIDTYFTRVFNPVWTYPDGFMWMDALAMKARSECTSLLPRRGTKLPTLPITSFQWGIRANDTILFLTKHIPANGLVFVNLSYVKQCEKWAKRSNTLIEANPGEVWEEDEFWIELSWRIDPDGSLGVREHFNSPYREKAKKLRLMSITGSSLKTPKVCLKKPLKKI